MLNLQPPAEGAAQTAEGAREGFNAGDLIIEHVSNTSVDHPLIHLPRVFGIDMSVTKHVLMLWIVAAILFFGLTWIVRRYLKQDRLIPDRTTTANYNVTAALATVAFFAIIVAGTQAHGFVQHWKNLAPKGLPWPIYFLLIPIEILGMFVRPFALTMRLAANMAGGHIAILALLSLIFVFTQLFGRAIAGVGVGMVLSLPIGVGLTALELIVILVQAYVFTLLTAVFIGMAIHA